MPFASGDDVNRLFGDHQVLGLELTIAG